MEVTTSENIADMVTMSSNGQSRVGSIVSSTVCSGIDSGSSRNTSGLTMVECQNITNNNCIQGRSASNNNNNNGDNASWQTVPQDPSKMNKLREIVENSASVASKCIVDNLLQQVSQLSDLDKFLLYLKLPVGRTPDLDPLKQPLNPLGSRSEIQLTITWMKTHLEIDLEVSLPKEEVYNEYMHYCNSNGFKALSTADFGKVMKQVFPSVRARRLGHRGASKYCHSGLRKKFVLDVPTLPDLSAESPSNGSNYGEKNGANAEFSLDDVDKAAGYIIFEWAEKKFSVKADNYKDLALQLIEKNLADPRSGAAYTLLSIDQRTGGGKHRETQYQLQKKLQEREQQKRKLQEQQPGLTKSCSERPKTRRRSGSIRNASGDSSSGSTSQMSSYANSKTTIGSSSNSNVKANYGLSNQYDVETNNNNKSMSDNKVNIKTATSVCPGTRPIIKQEDNSTVSQHKNIFADKDFSICNINNINNSTTTNGGMNNSNQKLMRAISLDSTVGLSSITKVPSNKTYLVMANTDSSNASNHVNSSGCSKSRYCPIQPKGNGSENLNNQNNNNNMQEKEISVNNLNSLHQWNENPSNPRCLEINSTEIFHCNIAGSNETDELQKKSQISELRKLLEKNLNSNSIPTGSSISRAITDDSPHIDIDHEMATTCSKRRVSFQPLVDSNDNLNRLSSMGSLSHVPQSPTMGNKSFNFTPINNTTLLNVSQGPSQASSANASPFVSPRSTPLHRSRHNSGQTSSTYVTPRSTPYTPDLSFPNNIHSDSNSPFMSPASTPLLNRTRHNSSQSFRPSNAGLGRPRHHSGNPSFRRTPYEEACNRRTKCRSRHDSGSIPLSPHSAPLSPLMHDSSAHTSGEPNIFHSHVQQPVNSSNSSLQNVLLKQHQQSTYIGCDLRRRHMSAGPYPPQTMPISYPLNQSISLGYNNDHLGQEVSNVMNNSPSGPSNLTDNSNRAQSVPLLQMLNTSCGSETDGMAKSHPNTPLINNTQFWYNTPSSDCYVSHPSSYAPTPVPSEFDDFIDYSNLGCDNELGIGPGSEDSGVNSFDDIYNNIRLPSSSDFGSVIDPSIRSDEVSSSMQTLLTSTTTYSLLSESKTIKDECNFSIGNQSNAKNENPQTSQASIEFSDASLLTLNAINNTLTSVLGNPETAFDPPSSVVDDFQNYNPFIEDAPEFSREFNPNSSEFMIPPQELLSRLEDG